MPRHACFVAIALLAIAACLTLACGGSHQIQSLSVSPSSADAKDYRNGQVQFTATGTFNSSPTTVTLTQANWGAETEQDGIYTGPTTAVSITANGLAQCAAGASGVYGIGAWVLVNPDLQATCESIGPFGQPGCNSVAGTSRLTCP